MALRNSVLAQIWKSLERSPFTPLDFTVDSTSGKALLEVAFNHSASFRFVAKRSANKTISVTMSPGEHEDVEFHHLGTAEDLPDELLKWTRHIRDELRATVPVYSELDELREALDRHIKEHVDHPEQSFSEEEADDLKAKLDELRAKFQEMQDRHELTQQEVDRLSQEIASIKANVDVFPKDVWYKTAANKLWLAVSKVATSKESRQLLAKAAQRMLGLDQ